MVEIPKALADKLDPLGPHFCLVNPRGKDPSVGGKGWQKPPKLMLSTDPRLTEWLAKGGNYGVVCGYGVIVIEADDPKIEVAVRQKLPPTFTVLSPGHQAPHFYFLCSMEECKPLIDPESKEKENIGHIKAQGGMVVGPGSIHPNGDVYRIVKDLPLAQVTPQQVREALKPYLIPEEQITRVEAAARLEKRETQVDLDILQAVPLAGLKRLGDEYYGIHPVHGSETGRNFWVNPRKNCWHCFRHGTGGGPLLWLAVEEGIIRCEEAGPGALRGEVFKRVLDKARERGIIKEAKLKEEKPIVLSHLNMIEDPEVAGKPVIVEAVVASTSLAYLAPAEIEAHITDKDGNEYDRNFKISEKNPVNIKLVGVNEDVKFNRLRRFVGECGKVYVEEKAWRTIYKIRVRPPVFTLEKRGEKIVDERGFEYKAYDIYVAADKPMAFQPSALIRVEGIALPNPKTQKTTLLAYKVEFPEEVTAFDVGKLSSLRAKFQGMTVSQRVNWILNNFERYSQIVGRKNLAEASLLGYFTPTWIRFNNEVQKGWGNILIIGDTTTAKSETLRKLLWLLKAGMLITAETASTVGLTGTATQVEKEGWFVDWGFLVLCDRGLLAVDGAHKLSLSNWCALAEAERSGVITIAKAAKNSAYARTRQVKIANAVDREADKYTTKSLASFLYPCQALTTILDKTSIARLDLAVFSDSRDVKAEEINKESDEEYDRDLEILSEALKWCWSDLAEIKFTKEAVKTLLTAATDIYNMFFSEAVPLASIDMKWKLARLSAALAYLTLSTEDFSTVIVTEDHVNAVVDFIKDEYSKAGLNTLAQETKYESLTMEDVNFTINTIISKTEGALDQGTIENIFKFIVLQGRVTRDQLKTKFGLAEVNQLRPLLAVLSNEKLVRLGRGLYPTPKLVQAYKLVLSRLSTLSTLEKEGVPPNFSEKGGGGFFSDLVNLVNLDKKVKEQVEKPLPYTIETAETWTDKKKGQKETPFSKKGDNGRISIQSVLSKLERLTTNIQDRCVNCGFQGRIYWQVTLRDGSWGLLCERCGSKLEKQLGLSERWEWEGFHAIGRSIPEQAYQKTVNALFEYVEIEKTNVIADGVLEKALSYYWKEVSYDSVKQRLIKEGILKPFKGKFLIVENSKGNAEGEG